jgi:branched-chain amino acid transport system permease protein
LTVERLLLFGALGLGTGALIAGLALSLVVTYRGSGIIHLATGAVALVAAYAFWSFRTGVYGYRFGTAPALVLTLAVSIVVGLLTELLAFRPLRTASPLAKLVASLGLLLLAQALVILGFGPYAKIEPSFLPSGTVAMLGAAVPIVNFVLAGIVIVVATVLFVIYRWTHFGLATRAASESELSAMTIGLSPNRLSMINTLVASVIAGMLGVLVAPLIVLDPVTLSLQVVPALAAALFARFSSFGIACVVGLLIGAAENIIYYLSTQSWFPTDHGAPLPGLQELLVFVLIVIAMFWRGASLPGRGDLVEKRLPIVPRPERLLRPALVAAIVLGVALIVFPFDFRQALMNSVIGAVLVLSLVVLTGFIGQISVVQLALAGAAGFVVSHLAMNAGIAFPAAPLIGAIAATVLGLVTAVSALRIRGVQLAVVTLAAAVALEHFWFINSTWGAGQTGALVPQPHLLGIDLGNDAPFKGLDGKTPSPILGFLFLGVAIMLCVLVAHLRRSHLGQQMLSVRANEQAAAAAGINVRNVKLAAFALSGFIAGIAGAMYAYNFGSVSDNTFSTLTAFGFIAFAYVGGITMVSGAVIAGLITTEGLFSHALDKWFGLSGTWLLLFGAVTLIFNLILYPDGVAGGIYRKKQRKRLEAIGLASPTQTLLQKALARRPGGTPRLDPVDLEPDKRDDEEVRV